MRGGRGGCGVGDFLKKGWQQEHRRDDRAEVDRVKGVAKWPW